jgi:hypothetical protein
MFIYIYLYIYTYMYIDIYMRADKQNSIGSNRTEKQNRTISKAEQLFKQAIQLVKAKTSNLLTYESHINIFSVIDGIGGSTRTVRY